MANKQEIISQLAQKYHLSESQVRDAVQSQFKFAKQSMERDDMPQVRLPFFGVFKIDKRKVKHINENYKKKHGISRREKQSRQADKQSEE